MARQGRPNRPNLHGGHMPSTASVRWIRSANLRRRYIGVGRRPEHLYAHLDFLTGVRGQAERVLMRLAPVMREAVSPGVLRSIDPAVRMTGKHGSALLLWTADYKRTWFVGPL